MDDKALAVELKQSMSRLLKVLRREMKDDDALLSLTERSSMGTIYRHKEITPSELAAIQKVTNQSMSQIINKLANFEYVKKTPSKQDRRKKLITITVKGRAFIEHRHNKKEEWLARAIREKISQPEKEILHQSVNILKKLVD